ncbi:glycosyltransferase [Flavobacterium qiangtangense]|uniref:Glycosyltransferase n=1 Tax=Flavobacterium qiangtangense TaxID=1442595 RepID=A0ABW1PTB6_9FLAO
MKKTIIISGVNLSEGGPLTVISSVLNFLDQSDYVANYRIIALVHSKDLFQNLKNIELMAFSEVKSSWFKRLKFEYRDCLELSKELESHLWFSLHDITPNVISVKRAVYCHNASPFHKQNLKVFFQTPLRYLYVKFYKQLYSINIKKNDFVVVQQKWIKEEFIKMFHLKKEKIIVALPDQAAEKYLDIEILKQQDKVKKVFFYPAFPREFKNFETICKAVELVKHEIEMDFEVILTIDGSENDYSRAIVDKYGSIRQISFIGLQSKDKVEHYYAASDCLLFPSKLETWGLPISEYKKYNKPMLVSDLPYAYETVGNYEKVKYFDPKSESDLSQAMIEFLKEKLEYNNKGPVFYEQPYCTSWSELFKHLLK